MRRKILNIGIFEAPYPPLTFETIILRDLLKLIFLYKIIKSIFFSSLFIYIYVLVG